MCYFIPLKNSSFMQCDIHFKYLSTCLKNSTSWICIHILYKLDQTFTTCSLGPELKWMLKLEIHSLGQVFLHVLLTSYNYPNLFAGGSWSLVHSRTSGNFSLCLTTIIGCLWHTALHGLNSFYSSLGSERDLCARDSLNCTSQPLRKMRLNNEQSI